MQGTAIPSVTIPAVHGQEITVSDAISPRGVRIIVWGAGFPPAGTVTVHETILPTPGQRSSLVISGSALDSDRSEFREFPETAGPRVGE
ncbi:hypothetical protein GCM10009691_19290 [Brevibacterium picturae]|uniref:IPT/TIG domain-containing protein n=1 Tax=Brevibacterium picturae TaxID=260553 RepID=A0ABP4MIB1_9MICO